MTEENKDLETVEEKISIALDVAEPEMFNFNWDDSWDAVHEILHRQVGSPAFSYNAFNIMRNESDSNKREMRKYFPENGRLVAEVSFLEMESIDKQTFLNDALDKVHNLYFNLIAEYRHSLTNPDDKQIVNDQYIPHCSFWNLVTTALRTLSLSEIESGRLDMRRQFQVSDKNYRFDPGTKIMKWLRGKIADDMRVGSDDKFYTKAFDLFASAWSTVPFDRHQIDHFVVLSINPLDVLLASECTNGWHSCHALDGEYAAGQLSYLTCRYTAIQYAYRDIRSYEGYQLPAKMWRQWAYMQQDGVLQMRHYPQSFPAFAKTGRKLIGRVLHDWNGLSNHNIYVRKSGYQNINIFNSRYQFNYVDDPEYHNARLVQLCLDHENVLSQDVDFDNDIGGPVYCLSCGAERDPDCSGEREGSFLCNECDSTTECICCGGYVDSDTAIYFNGSYYCSDCAEEHLSRCIHCGDYVHNDDAMYYGDNAYCESCFGNNFTCCSRCGCDVPNCDASTVDGDDYCSSCYEKFCTTCEECGDDIVTSDACSVMDDKDNEYILCSDCTYGMATTCNHCGDLYYKTTLTETKDGNRYCNVCLQIVIDKEIALKEAV